MQAILAGYAGYLDALRANGMSIGAATNAFARFRTLCAVRDGARGVDAINRLVSEHFRSALNHPLDPGKNSEWYPGRPVMVLRNDYVLKLFNGDIGIVMPDDSPSATISRLVKAGKLRLNGVGMIPTEQVDALLEVRD